MNSDILDNKENTLPDELRNALHYWEGKRLIYNVIVGISGLLSVLFNIAFFSLEDLILIFLWGIFANIMFTCAFLLEALEIYYLHGKLNLHNFRTFFLVVGILLSSLITFFGGMFFYELKWASLLI